jgi:hypothetical protein
MEAKYATDLVNGLCSRPGYKVSARVTPFEPVGTITLEIEFDTFDSSEPPNFPRKITLAPSIDVNVMYLRDDKELLSLVFRFIMEVEAHEWQEFLRLDRAHDYVAPFHPHTAAGMAAQMAYGAMI